MTALTVAFVNVFFVIETSLLSHKLLNEAVWTEYMNVLPEDMNYK